MSVLIQTSICSIVYGYHNGKENQELFRCPRELDNIDLRRYVNEHRNLFGFEDDVFTADLRKVNNRELIGYYRMYFRDHSWYGRWMLENGEPDRRDCYGVQQIIDWIVKEFPNGCSYKMKEYFHEHHRQVSSNRYLVKPIYSDFYKVMIDTTYGNGDYPVRIYVYRKETSK